MKIFATGGTGFVGQVVIKTLIDEGFDVLALSRSNASSEKLERLGAKCLIGSLETLADWRHHLADCQGVLHAAAQKSGSSINEHMANNCDATLNLAKAAQDAQIKRFVFISTGSLAIQSRTGISRHKETDPIFDKDWSPYLSAKAAAERGLDQLELESISLRPCLIWGANAPFQDICSGAFWANIAGGKFLHSTLHVENLAHAISQILATRQRPPKILNLNDDETRRLDQLVKAFRHLNGKSQAFPIAFALADALAQIADLGYRAAKPSHRLGARAAVRMFGRELTTDDSLIRHALGYKAKVSIDEGLERLAHPHALP